MVCKTNDASDSGSAVLGVYLFGYHVIPLLLLGVGTCAGPDLNCRSSRVRALHVADCLVCMAFPNYIPQLMNDREFCLRHPEVMDVCDIGQMLFWNSQFAWYFTAVMFLLNNTFIQGLHVLVISRYLNTMTNHSVCTVGFAAIGAVVSWVCSMPRTFNALAKLATVSAFFTFVSVILAAAFAGAEGKHGTAGYSPVPTHVDPVTGKTVYGGEPIVLAIPAAGTTFVSGMNAFLNIAYTFIGQITLPSFIAEMKNPYDFRKALWLVTICEIVVFSLVGAIGKSVRCYVGMDTHGLQCMHTPARNTTQHPHLGLSATISTRRCHSRS
jgi:hypothetical protein